MLDGLLRRRFIAVLGKGGTGKTTVSGVIALRAAAEGKRVLVAMAQAKERLSAMLETEYVESDVKPILANIDAVNMDPEACLEEYGLMVLRVRALYKAVMDNRVVKGFLRAVPGMDAWSMLGKALYHSREGLESGRPRYDLVILDAPATGHGLQMLRVPQVICDVAPTGLLRREAENGLAELRDPRMTGIVVVSLPEEMPTTETEELVGTLRNELRFPIAGLVVNQVLTPLLLQRESQALRAADALDAVGPFAPIGQAVRMRVTREGIQRSMLSRLERLEIPTMTLPALAVEQVRRPEMQQLADVMRAAGV